MSHSHGEPLHWNSFYCRKLRPVNFSLPLAHLSLLLLENRRHLGKALFAIRQNTNRERKHAVASGKAEAVLIGLSFTVDHCVIGWSTVETIMQQLRSFPSCFKYFGPKHNSTLLWELFSSSFWGVTYVSCHCTGVIFDKSSSLDVGQVSQGGWI